MVNAENMLNMFEEWGCKVFPNEPMSKHTTFKIGGNADIFLLVPSKNAMVNILTYCSSNKMNLHILGNGSNLLVSDEGIRGICAKYDANIVELDPNQENVIKCSSCVSLSMLCNFAMEHSLSGLEFASGIPGTLGGAVYMNAGAYGCQISDVFFKSEHLDRSGNSGYLDKQSIDFSYRKSAYSVRDFFIETVYLKLEKGNKEKIKKLMREYRIKRSEKQPLNFPSAGSVFKRPEGMFAGRLIEECGLKGFRIGDAQVSTKHAGFIVNVGKASCEDVLTLIKKIKTEVYNKRGVELECEIKVI